MNEVTKTAHISSVGGDNTMPISRVFVPLFLTRCIFRISGNQILKANYKFLLINYRGISADKSVVTLFFNFSAFPKGCSLRNTAIPIVYHSSLLLPLIKV